MKIPSKFKKAWILLFLFLFGLISLTVGASFGFWYRGKVLLSLDNNKVIQQAVKTVYGQVVAIKDQKITLRAKGEDLTIFVNENTSITRVPSSLYNPDIFPETETPEKITLTLSELRIGHWASGYLVRREDGSFVATELIVSEIGE